MKFFGDFINQYGMEILFTLLTAIAGYLGTQLKKIYEKKCDDELKKKIVKTCVKAVEQMYHDLSGTEKYEKALESIEEMLAEKGLTCTELEIMMLIEATVCSFNYSLWGDEEDG